MPRRLVPLVFTACTLDVVSTECMAGFVATGHGACALAPDAGNSGAIDTAGADTGADTAATGARDVVVIVLDTARYGLFDAATMPHLVSRVSSGVYVANMTNVGAWTRPTTAALMTGRRWEEVGDAANPEAIADGLPTIASIYASAGYDTYLNSANGVMNLTNFTAPFDEADIDKPDVGLRAQAADADAFLDAHDAPSLVWLQAMETHFPYDQLDDSCAEAVYVANETCPISVTEDPFGTSAFSGTALLSLTDSERAACGEVIEAAQRCTATRLDAELESLLTTLGDEPIVAIVSDHGEGWLDPGADHNWGTSQKLTRGFFLLLNSEHTARTVATASQVDLLPTLLRESGLSSEGLDLEGAPLGEAATAPQSAWWCDGYGNTEVAVWQDDRQLLRLDGGVGSFPQYHLFDTLADPAGDHNLLASTESTGAPAALIALTDAKMERTRGLCRD